MKNNVITIMKKEITRIWTDRKLFVSAVILPGVLLFVMYTIMGNFMSDLFTVDEEHIYQVHVVNEPDSLRELFVDPALRLNMINTSESDIDRIRQQVQNREADLLVVFPANFDTDVATFDAQTAATAAPNIQIWSNSARSESAAARSIVSSLLNAYHHSLTHRFTINAPSADAPDGNFELATDADMMGMVMGFLIPMMFIMFIFTGAQSLAPESIAGEKERGTLGGMLVTPTRRRDIALGKVLGIGLFALMSAVVAIIGLMLGMPSLVGLEISNIFEIFSVSDIALMLGIAAATSLVFVSLLSLLSGYAKSVKEATAYATPFMLISVVAGLAGAVLGGAPSDIGFYFIPVVNSGLAITAIVDNNVIVLNLIVTILINIVVALLLTWCLAKLFASEKIVFDK